MVIPYKPGDFIGITTVPVNIGDRSAAVRRKALQRIDVMANEIAHLQLALNQLKHTLITEPAFSSNSQRTFTHAMMNARNWALSLAISHCFIQRLFGSDATAEPLSEMFERAARDGLNDAITDPDYRAWENAHTS